MSLRRALISSVFVIALACVGLSVGLSFAPSSVALDEWRDLQDVNLPTESSPLFSYQGHLLDKSGTAITNGSVPMAFAIYPQGSGGTSCWEEIHSGGNAVEVQDGIFQVTLGQITAITANCVAEEAYLQLTVNGEVMSPRERLTSAATAVRAESLAGGATVFGDLKVNGKLITDESVHTAGQIVNGGVNFFMRGTGQGDIALRAVGSERTLHLLPYGGSNYDQVCIGCGSPASFRVNGNARIHGDMTLLGDCVTTSLNSDSVSTAGAESCSGGSLTTAAVIEANLQTPEELRSERIDRFGEGDLLCWGGEKLEVCSRANDRAVQAVANFEGRPIVLGAELIRVTGKVNLNDILVTSSEPGHAMVNNNPLPGTVIGQALESFEGESGLVKAMIRKW